MKKWLCIFIVLANLSTVSYSQLVINEASNRNFNTLLDEDQESEDWIEIYNAGPDAIDLNGYSLSDNLGNLSQWTFSSYTLVPGEFLIVFCSGKDRYSSETFQNVVYIEEFTPVIGWNQHDFEQPFMWDGVSDIIVDACSYNNQSYTNNSIFRQTATSFISTLVSSVDGSDAACGVTGGQAYFLRPNIRLNGLQIGNGDAENTGDTYPAPYGNWYWSARNQMLFRAEELIEAGITAGPITDLAWDVAATNGELYTYVNVRMRQMELDELSSTFINNLGAFFHTNFRIGAEGETVYLTNPSGEIVDDLLVTLPSYLASVGSFPDGEDNATMLSTPTPGASNNDSSPAIGICSFPLLSLDGGIYASTQNVLIYDSEPNGSQIYYTLNGEEPTENSTLYTGEEIPIFFSSVLRARAYTPGKIPSEITTATYLINISHITPIVTVATNPENLYGESGIFENWWTDWERYAQISFYDSTNTHSFVFDRDAAIQVDGGAGGSRSNPQTSFRLEMAKGAFNELPVQLPLLSNRPERSFYTRLYFRNGSNQYLVLPYKDACQLEMLVGGTFGYYSAMRPASVYINGQYFGLYEMREKLDGEYFRVYDNFDNESADVLSLSFWNNSILRATEGNADNYWQSLANFTELDWEADDFIEQANEIYDLQNYTDYVIGQSWVGNTDWPQNNIKIYRSDSSDMRWRFASIDFELSLQPNGWTDCFHNGVQHVLNQGFDQPFVGPWNRAMQNTQYSNYFINRFADLNNTLYQAERLLGIEQKYFDEWALEMPKTYARWSNPSDVANLMTQFYNNHITFQDELLCKTEVIRDQIEESLGLEGQFELTLQTFPEGAGKIHINTITPETYPWNGIYYKGIPVQITAEANPGYTFLFWDNNEELIDVFNPEYLGSTTLDDITFTAVFDELVGVEDVNVGSISTLSVYPNPAINNLNLRNDEKSIHHFEVINTSGQVVMTRGANVMDHLVSIPVNNLSKGLYVIKVYYRDGGIEQKRWMKN
jgi:hypothetical protein